MNIASVLKNKVFFYLVSRYITYGIQFVTSLVVAAELGPYYMGIWGFALLLLQYFQQFHLGIANSFNVLYVHNRDNLQECNNYIGNSLVLVCYLALLVLFFYLYYCIFGIDSFERYHVDKYVVWICLVAILQYFVQFFINLFRVKNQLNRVTFCQSIIVLLNFFCVFFYKGEELIEWLLAGYVFGNILCMVLAFTSGTIPNPKSICIDLNYQRIIINKGIYLFLYNSCFYFIIISIRTIISINYSVEEFGMFTFSFTLAHAIMLFLEALSFVLFPKVVAKLSSKDMDEVKKTLSILRTSYITSAHFLILIALLLFPIVIIILPKYEGALTSMNLIALTVLIQCHSFGYTELLISRNKEKTMAALSFFSLLFNVVLALVFVCLCHIPYSYAITATLITYYLFTLFAVYLGTKYIFIDSNIKNILNIHFPFRLLIPYASVLLVSLLQVQNLIFMPILLFVLLNINIIKDIKNSIRKLIIKPEIVNL